MNLSEIQKIIKKIIDDYKSEINELSTEKRQIIKNSIKEIEERKINKILEDTKN